MGHIALLDELRRAVDNKPGLRLTRSSPQLAIVGFVPLIHPIILALILVGFLTVRMGA